MVVGFPIGGRLSLETRNTKSFTLRFRLEKSTLLQKLKYFREHFPQMAPKFQMQTYILLLLLSVLAAPCSAQVQAGQFNIFKNYANAKVRPIQYARVSRKHAIGEYLDITQKKMMKYRNGRDSTNLMFTDRNWNGNIKDNTNTGETRRLTKIEDAVIMPITKHAEGAESFSYFLLLAITVVAVMSIAMIRYILKRNIESITALQDLQIPEESV